MFGISKVKYILFLLVFIATSSFSDIIHDNNTSKETKLIKLSTNMGDITLELYADKAPETVANFLWLEQAALIQRLHNFLLI